MTELVKPTLKDIPQMMSLVENEIKNGTILYRSEDEIATNIRSYVVVKDGDSILAYGALHIHSPDLAEIRSLIVGEEYRGKSLGTKIVNYAIGEAERLKIKKILVLTYIPKFFTKLGFNEIPKESIPDHKIWADCIKCIHFPVCNEVSLMYDIKSKSDNI